MAYKIGWFSTGKDESAIKLLEIIQRGILDKEISAELVYLFSNRQKGEAIETDRFFELVEGSGIKLITYSSSRFSPALKKVDIDMWRREYYRQVMALIADYEVDIIFLAGYMLIVSEELCNKYKMLNLHPAKPGGHIGTWQEVIWQLIAENAQESGVTIHLVTPELDKGPPITYCMFKIRGEIFDRFWENIKDKPINKIIEEEGESNPLFKLIREEGVKQELPLIFYTIKELANGKIKITELLQKSKCQMPND